MDDLLTSVRLRVKKHQVVHIKLQKPTVKNWKLKVKVGQEVYPADELGEGEISAGFRNVHLSEELQVRPNVALNFLKKKINENIYEGELLASKKDLFGLKKTLLLSPADGILELYDDKKGDLKIKLFPKKYKSLSGVYGIVDEVDEKIGSITIRTLADLVYGVAGVGRKREGVLNVIGNTDLLVSSRQLSKQHERQIIVGGSMIFEEGLRKAMNSKIEGIITGGINTIDFRKMTGGSWNFAHQTWFDSGLTLVVTEGFGSVPIGDDIFALLKEHQGKFVIIEGNRPRIILPSYDEQCMMYIRKVSLPIIPDPEPDAKIDLVKLEIGKQVRIVSQPYLGIQGSVESIDKTPSLLPTGIKTYLVIVETSSRKIRVPYLNLEII